MEHRGTAAAAPRRRGTVSHGDQHTAQDDRQRHRPGEDAAAGRVMVWIGLAAGTAITVLAVTHGIRIPGLRVVLSVLVTWVLLMVLAVTVAELARRHHRAAARHAWRHSRRQIMECHRSPGGCIPEFQPRILVGQVIARGERLG
jgi:small-conductance mechanosensitive channel